jgi:hypothetical protein
MGGQEGISPLSKTNIKTRVTFARQHLGKDQNYWNNVLWTEGIFGKNKTLPLNRRTSYQP